MQTFGSLLSIKTVNVFSRRTLLIYGRLIICVIYILLGWFNHHEQLYGAMAMILLFLFVFQNSSGSVSWIYVMETSNDAGLGICLFTLWGTIFTLSLVSPILLSPHSIGATNVFYIFSAISFIATIFTYGIIKETQGLSDKEKKQVYTPDKYLS